MIGTHPRFDPGDGTALMVTASLDLQTVLDRGIDLIGDAFPGSESCVYLFDEESQELVLSAGSVAMPSDHVGPVRVALGEGAIGWVGATRERFPSTVGTSAGAAGEAADQLLCVPIVSHADRLVGVAAIWPPPDAEPSADAAGLAAEIAEFLAGPLENARVHASIVRRAQAIDRMAEVTALTTSGIPTVRVLDLVTELARDVGDAEVAVMLAADPAGGDRLMLKTVGTPSSSEQRDRLQAVRRELVALDAEIRRGGTTWPAAAESLSSRLRPWFGTVATVPLSVAGEDLGVICCYRVQGRRFTAEDQSLLATVAGQAALALKNAWLAAELVQQQNELGHFIRDLSTGRLDATGLRAHAEALGIDSGCGHHLIVGSVSFGAQMQREGERAALVLRQLAHRLAEVATDARCAAGPREIVALIPAGDRSARLASLVTKLSALCNAVRERTDAHVTFGISHAASPTELRRALAEAREVAALGASGAADGGVFTLDDVSHQLLLRRAADAATAGDRYSRAVEAIAEYDRVSNSALLHTLSVFLHVRSRTEAARALYVHRNTLAQRLRRIEELTGVPVADSDEWFPLQLALQIHLIRHPGAGPP